MVKLIQICASQDDLFGLDEDGTVYQYNFGLPFARGEAGAAPAGAVDGRALGRLRRRPGR